MIVVSDASSLILLEKINLLDKLVKKHKFIITQEIYNEAVTKGMEKKSPDAYHIEEKIKNKVIMVKELKNSKMAEKLMKDFGIAGGEAETIAIFSEIKADMVVLDDHKSINICKIYNMPFMTALTFVLKAFDNKIIGKGEAKKMIEELDIHGRYKDELIYESLKYIGG